MTKPVLLVNKRVPAPIRTALLELGQVTEYSVESEGDFPDAAVALVTGAMDPVSSDMICRLPRSVGLIANIGVGTDNIDLTAAKARGIQVSNTPVVTDDTADLAMGLVLMTSRRTTNYEKLLREGLWEESMHPSYYGRSVHGKTLGIVGFGSIGQALARRAAAFSMRLLYHGPRRKRDAERQVGATFCPNIGDLFRQSDVVSLNCPSKPETRHIVNAKSLLQFKPGAVLINTGRGPLLDETAVVHELLGGRLSAVGLDVHEHEPRVNRELLKMQNVTLLPHIGSWTVECQQAMRLRLIDNVKSFLRTGFPLDRVEA
ncbi:MAG: D-glycerate dehydrogenase [Gammaproteobacteria bacterium]|nr:D-glycerate dehydrogenase [Gammaproteobacteria bacterium]MDH4255361.1 D-glycerate dehydrogenase [Gammaproteobacteria bacterium]MDH5311513.1 D-glycerate dehydrogenase [Gammaproteobacteria bacterium]